MKFDGDSQAFDFDAIITKWIVRVHNRKEYMPSLCIAHKMIMSNFSGFISKFL